MNVNRQKIKSLTRSNTPSTENKIAENLNKLMRENHIRPKELSQYLNISASTINSILYQQKKNPTFATLNAIADYFCISIDQLISKTPINPDRLKGSFNPDSLHLKSIPILALDQIKNWLDNEIDLGNFTEQQLCLTHLNVSEEAFAIRVSGESLKPRFSEGTILIMEHSIQSKDQDIVLVQFKDSESSVFRQIFFDGHETYFRPMNPEFGKMILQENYEILGIMICAIINRG